MMFHKSYRYFGFTFISLLAFFFSWAEPVFPSALIPSQGITCTNGSVKIETKCPCPSGFWEPYPRCNNQKQSSRHQPVRPSRANAAGDRQRQLAPHAGNELTYSFTHTLEGEWDDVVGYVGFRFTDPTTKKDFFACLIGLPVESLDNGQYQSEDWDKKVFWIEVGDGAPMHFCATYAPNYEEDGELYDNVFWSPSFQYLPPGVQDENLTRPCDMWLFLNEDDEVEEVWIDIFDENWEITKTKELAIGDRLKAYTTILDPNDPDALYGLPLEDRFQTVKKPAVFLYEHMTPNVDFVNENTKGFDYDNADLLFVLFGESESEDGVYSFAYSTPKNVNLKWGNKPAKTENWFQHEISGILNFFMPTR